MEKFQQVAFQKQLTKTKSEVKNLGHQFGNVKKFQASTGTQIYQEKTNNISYNDGKKIAFVIDFLIEEISITNKYTTSFLYLRIFFH